MDKNTETFSANLLLCSNLYGGKHSSYHECVNITERAHLNVFQKTQAMTCHSYTSVRLCCCFFVQFIYIYLFISYDSVQI